MKQIYMDGESDCTAACIAMVLGLPTAKAAYPLLGYDPDESAIKGATDQEVMNLLHSMGRTVRYIVPREQIAKDWKMPTQDLDHRVHLLTEHTVRGWLEGMQKGCALVGVPSLNHPGGYHFVFCFKGVVYDPSRKQRYIGSAGSLPVACAIFIED